MPILYWQLYKVYYLVNTETEYCTESEYRCDNGICIQKKGICDGTQKCLDGSDKKYTMCEVCTNIYYF